MQKVLSKILRFFLQGVLVVAPIAVTAYLIYWLFTSIDNILPIFTSEDKYGNVSHHNYGLGFLIIIISLVVIGFLSGNFIFGKLFIWFDKWMEHTPGIKVIYSTVKDFFEGFAGNKRKFTKPVRVRIRTSPELWQIGFITQENIDKIGEDLIAVYMPHSYAVSGVVVLVHKNNVVPITNLEPSAVMKMAISGGVTGYDDDSHEALKKI